MDVRRLQSFTVLAQHLNFSRAAEALDTSQPALSHQIASLEKELGVRLFERSKRRVELTTAGTEYLESIRGAMDLLDKAADRAREAQSGRLGSLAITTIGMAMLRPLPKAVRAFSKRFPQTKLSLSVLRNPHPIEAVRSHQANLAFAIEKGVVEEALGRVPLWSFDFRVVLPADHQLARQKVVNLLELEGEVLITPPQRGETAGGDGTVSVCRELGFVPASVQEVAQTGDIEAILGLVSCGRGFSILPTPYETFGLPSVVFKPIRASKRRMQISAFWRLDDTNPLVANFVEIASATNS